MPTVAHRPQAISGLQGRDVLPQGTCPSATPINWATLVSTWSRIQYLAYVYPNPHNWDKINASSPLATEP